MKYAIDEHLRPPPHFFYGDSYERGLDPWHKDAFPEEFKDRMPGGPRIGGWFLVDAWGNQIGFVGDGTTIECTPTQMRKFPKDLVDELMRQGADVVADQIAENCEACGHEMSEHGPGGCAVRMDSAWTADNTKPCGWARVGFATDVLRHYEATGVSHVRVCVEAVASRHGIQPSELEPEKEYRIERVDVQGHNYYRVSSGGKWWASGDWSACTFMAYDSRNEAERAIADLRADKNFPKEPKR